jgi:Transcriptional regulator, AbiEi antitoxin
VVFSRLQAKDLGVSDVRLASLVRRGYLVKVRRGVYARAVAERSSQRYVQASTAALTQRGPGHVLSHLSAAALWGLPMPLRPPETVHLTTTVGAPRSRRVPGLEVHHADSSETDVVETAGVPMTTVARTVADCLRSFWPRVSVPIADAALNRGLTSMDEVVVQLAMQCHWPGRTRSEQSLAIVDGRRESWLESYAFVRFSEWELDLPEPQVSVFDEGGRFVARVDGGWLDDGTVLELDGKSKYELPHDGVVDPESAWRSEKERYDRVGNLGLERVRFGLDDLLHRDGVIRAQIRARRQVGSAARFTGRFERTPASGLTLLSVSERRGAQN